MSSEKKDFWSSIPDVGNINLGNINSSLGNNDPDFIVTSADGKESSLRMFYETGVWWLLGFGFGGVRGIKEGWSSAANGGWRLRMNGIMNGMSKHGGKLSNVFAVLAMTHTGIVWGCDYAQIDYLANSRLATPLVSGSLVGGGFYAFSNGIRGKHFLRTGGAIAVGALCSCAYMLGRPLIVDNLFSNKRKARY